MMAGWLQRTERWRLAGWLLCLKWLLLLLLLLLLQRWSHERWWQELRPRVDWGSLQQHWWLMLVVQLWGTLREYWLLLLLLLQRELLLALVLFKLSLHLINLCQSQRRIAFPLRCPPRQFCPVPPNWQPCHRLGSYSWQGWWPWCSRNAFKLCADVEVLCLMLLTARWRVLLLDRQLLDGWLLLLDGWMAQLLLLLLLLQAFQPCHWRRLARLAQVRSATWWLSNCWRLGENSLSRPVHGWLS